jgi:hypothetical protein
MISPNKLLVSKFYFLSKKINGSFFVKFFSFFLIFQIFYEIKKKNFKKQKVILKWIDANYSNFFYNSLYFLLKKIDFIFSAKNSKNLFNFENNNDYIGHEQIVSYFSSFKKYKKSISIQNFYSKKLNFLNKNLKFIEILVAFRKIGFFQTFFGKTKNRILNLFYLQSYNFDIETSIKKKNLFNKYLVQTPQIEKDFQLTVLLEKTKTNVKGVLTRLKSNWLNFNDFIFIFRNYNKILKSSLKKKNFLNKKIKLRKISFFLYDDFENFIQKNNEKWEQIVNWNEKNAYNLYIQENHIDSFFMNFHQIDLISRLDLIYLMGGLFIHRILKIEEIVDFNFFFTSRSVKNCWVKKCMYLSSRFFILNLISLNSNFFPEMRESRVCLESSSAKKNFLSRKKTRSLKNSDIYSKKEIQTYMKFRKQNLYSSTQNARVSGKSEKYENFL